MEQVVQSLIAVNLLPNLYGTAENDNFGFHEYFRHPEAPSEVPDKIEKVMQLCPDSTQLNFAKAENFLKEMVFWSTIPLLALNFALMSAMVIYLCTRQTKFCQTNWLTKLQFALLAAIQILSCTLIAMFTYT